MKLTTQQLKTYQEKGFLIIESLFTSDEIDELRATADNFENRKELPTVICEKSGDIRTVFAPHRNEYIYEWLYQQERLIVPTQQLLDDAVYLYQYKLNNKRGFGGDWWEWHQDFAFWQKDDGVPTPNLVSAMILFQDTSSIQGPLMFLAGSHRDGIVDFQNKTHLQNEELKVNDDLVNALSADIKYTVNQELLKKMAMDSEIAEGKGPKGTCIFFHPNLFHASNSNISPFDRFTAILTYNAINNLPIVKGAKRPDYICAEDYSPIKAISSPLKVSIHE